MTEYKYVRYHTVHCIVLIDVLYVCIIHVALFYVDLYQKKECLLHIM